MAIVAIGLKRFELKHGTLPATLADLSPEFVASIPPDPVDGKPLRYHRDTADGFTLYSVGENGSDDGGDESPLRAVENPTASTWYWLRARDWVWPKAASASEFNEWTQEEAARAAAKAKLEIENAQLVPGNSPLDPATGLPVRPAPQEDTKLIQ